MRTVKVTYGLNNYDVLFHVDENVYIKAEDHFGNVYFQYYGDIVSVLKSEHHFPHPIVKLALFEIIKEHNNPDTTVVIEDHN